MRERERERREYKGETRRKKDIEYKATIILS